MNRSAPKVTVLMPAYNHERFLVEAVESILRQTFTDFELLAIDDGSTDRSADLLGRCADPRVRVLSNPSNRGISFSLNRGIRAARGEYIVRMDADDISLPRRIEAQVRFMESHPEIGASGTRALVFGEKRNIVMWSPTGHQDIRCALLFGVPLCHPTLIMRRRILIEQGLWYSDAFRYAEDYPFLEACSRVTRLANLDRVLLHYRVHSQQVSRGFHEQQRQSRKQVYAALLQELGVPATRETLDIHEAIQRGETPLGMEQLERAESWLMELLKANARVRQYDEEAFGRLLSRKWLSACRSASSEGMDVWRRFLASPLTECAGLGTVRLLKRLAVGVWSDDLKSFPRVVSDHNREDPARLLLKCLLQASGGGRWLMDRLDRAFFSG